MVDVTKDDIRDICAYIIERDSDRGAWRATNCAEWGALVRVLFPLGVPRWAQWYTSEDIVRILQVMGGKDSNYTFYPMGGGMTLESASASAEPGCIELVIREGERAEIVSPLMLTFDCPDPDLGWAYFRLELKPLLPVFPSIEHDHHEAVIEVAPGQYEVDDGESAYEGRRVSRFVGGSFLVVAKGSVLNGINGSDDGRHARVNQNEFRAYVDKLCEIHRGVVELQRASRAA